MKVIRFNTPNGQFDLPLRLVAENRANHYTISGYSYDRFKEEVDFVMKDDFEGIDWLISKTKFDDWKGKCVKINNKVKVSEDYFWCDSDDFQIIELSH